MRQMTVEHPDRSENASLPKRPGAADCLYYLRTGMCGYGRSCRFNHPPNNMVAILEGVEKQYPERIGQPECQFYMKTGTCKFGSSCKYHHPRERVELMEKMSLNRAGYPLRLGEKDCPYYMQTGSCKFGSMCKFNHPQPTYLTAPVAMPRAAMYSSAGPVSGPGWTLYQGRERPIVPLDIQQQGFGAAVYGGEPSSGNYVLYRPFISSSTVMGVPPALESITMPKDIGFPQRPGLPECQYYMRTGICKFGMSCRFHHPKQRIFPPSNCMVSPTGLPLRQGAEQCTFYMRHGTCKFGMACRFDHPMSYALSYRPSFRSWPIPTSSFNPVGSVLAFELPSLTLSTANHRSLPTSPVPESPPLSAENVLQEGREDEEAPAYERASKEGTE